MTDHNPTGQAFQQFEYLTLPLHVRDDHIERAWQRANERVAARFEADDRSLVGAEKP